MFYKRLYSTNISAYCQWQTRHPFASSLANAPKEVVTRTNREWKTVTLAKSKRTRAHRTNYKANVRKLVFFFLRRLVFHFGSNMWILCIVYVCTLYSVLHVNVSVSYIVLLRVAISDSLLSSVSVFLSFRFVPFHFLYLFSLVVMMTILCRRAAQFTLLPIACSSARLLMCSYLWREFYLFILHYKKLFVFKNKIEFERAIDGKRVSESGRERERGK